MGKPKQQVISRFFAPHQPKPAVSLSASPPPSPSSSLPTSSPKVAATVLFSPSKRLRSSHLVSSKTPKTPKLSPHTQNPVPTSVDPSLHQKFLRKLLEPSGNGSDVSASSLDAPHEHSAKYTPLEQQVVELKKRHPDVMLMIEVGYKYRFFGEDAATAARVLGIYAHVDHNFLTASIPTFRLNVHVRRLVSAGCKVGVVKQTETAAIKAHGSNRLGPFCRGLSALYTKATLEAAEDLGGEEEGCRADNNYLLCVVEREMEAENLDCGVAGGFDVTVGILAIEISTGNVVYGEFNDDFTRSGLESAVVTLSPTELLLGDPLSKETEKMLFEYAGPASNIRLERTSRDCFKDGGALAEVMSLYEDMTKDDVSNHHDQNIDGIEHGNHFSPIQGIMSVPELAVQALALTLRHLKQFGFERFLCLGASFQPFTSKMEMILSSNALQQLEVLKNNFDGSESGTLLQSLNHTMTIFGSRLLRHWVTHPLCDRNMICSRLDAVSEITELMGFNKALANSSGPNVEDHDLYFVKTEVYHVLSSVLTALGRSVDIQRGITRIFHHTATPSEFIAVIQAILSAGKQLQRLNLEENKVGRQPKAVSSVLLGKLILAASSSSVIGNAAKLLSNLNKDAADQRDLLNLFVISDGQFSEVAAARTAVQAAKEKLDLLIHVYRKEFGMHDLEFMSVSGNTHLIELPLNVRVPSNWMKVNGTKKTIRYHPPEVLTALEKLSLATEELTVVCRASWDSFLSAFAKHYAEFRAAVQALAALDCLHSFAVIARNKNYVLPLFVDNDEPVQINIYSGRHPVLESILQDNFVPNDTILHANNEFCQIVSGPNMGGKSSYIRQVALITIMAQVGSFVPASSAKLHVLDGIHTRMGSSDSIQRGRSTFLEELSEASHILHKCSARSLVILDEIGRGTSTHDGVAIAYATLHHLLEHKKCMTILVTHYPMIDDIKKDFPGSVGAYHVSYLTAQRNVDIDRGFDHEEITYLYKLVPGISERSFGFKVAQLAQLPSSCIERGIEMAAKLEAEVGRRAMSRAWCEEAGFKVFFSCLDSALQDEDDDPERCLRLLKRARSLAEGLIR